MHVLSNCQPEFHSTCHLQLVASQEELVEVGELRHVWRESSELVVGETQHLQAARKSQFTIHGQPEPETKKQRDILYRQGNSIAHIQFVVTNYARLY